MSTAATAVPVTDKQSKRVRVKARDNSRDSLRKLPTNWREIAILPTATISQRAIAAALALQEDNETAVCTDNPACAVCQREKAKGKINVSATVADHKYNVGYHSRERAGFVVKTSPAWTRKLWEGETEEALETVHRYVRAEVEKGSFEEPAEAAQQRKMAATLFDLKYEFFMMLNNASLEKAWKNEAMRLHVDNKETGDQKKATRLNELWQAIKTQEGVS